jgi:hypothetical protein
MFNVKLFLFKKKMTNIANKTANLYKIPKLNKYLLNVNVQFNNCKVSKNEECDLLVILDNSGSMIGSPIESAKSGISKLYYTCASFLNKSYLMTFNHETELYYFQKKNIVNQIEASGGTDFKPVFKRIRELLKDFKNNLTIVIFTDGCGSYTQFDIEMLRRDIRAFSYNCVVHTIGFTEQHDAVLLSQLTRIGSTIGSFQFIEECSNISDSIDNIVEYMLIEKTFVNILGKKKEIFTVELHCDDKNFYSGDLLLEYNLADGPYKLEINKHTVDIDIVTNELPPVDKLLKSINLEVLHLINYISTERNLTRNLVDKIREECEGFKVTLADVKTITLKTLPIQNQKSIKEKIYDVETLINEFHMNFLTSALTNTLTNAKIASLNNFAYRVIANRTLKLKLDKRTQDNIDLFDKMESIIEKKTRNIDFKSLNPHDFDGNCIISCMDYIESLKNSDCICLTLDIERPEAAIMDPSRVIIKSINSSIISGDTFLDAVKYSLENTNDQTQCHGGFNLNTDSRLFSGQSRENITGALPLFINDAHWSIARQKMKPIMGWMSTLNILGYTYEQVTTIPFSVLAKAIDDIGAGVTDFKKKVFTAVLDTCLTIYRESPSIREELIDSSGTIKFLKHPSERTIDCTPNLSIFLVKLLCGIKSGNLNLKYSQYVLLNNYIIEEEHRRKQVLLFPVDQETDIDKMLYTFLGIIPELDVEPKVKIAKLRAFEIIKQAKIVIKSGNKNSELNEEQIKYLTRMSIEEINNLVCLIETLKSDNEPRLENKMANEALIRFNEVTDKKMVHLRLLLTSFKAKHMADLINMDKTCINDLRDFQKLAIMVQNLHGRRNSDRRFYIEKCLYIDPIIDPANLLEREYHRIVNNEIHKQCNIIRSKCVNFFSDILRSTNEFYAYSDTVVTALGEFFLSILNFNTDY